jgi:phenylalanyl-tRNA synthetase alpha chain
LGHLKWTLETFLKAFFERDDIVLAAAPELFPVHRALGRGRCRLHLAERPRVIGGDPRKSDNGGWMEVLGSGWSIRKVIGCGLDPDEWQGFAFGTGVDRLAMLKYGMDDLRAFFDGDLRWLRITASRRWTYPI